MIKLERTSVMNFDVAVRGMRNPMQSWEKSDSYQSKEGFVLGKNDLDLAQRLTKAGSDERKFLRQIFVSVDVTAPLYWWKEYDTYKVGTVANSTSTMHKIHAKEFTPDDFSHEHLSNTWDDGRDLVYYNSEYLNTPHDVLEFIIEALNEYRAAFLMTKDKRYWWDMIQLLPSSYNQMRTCTLNYENLINIYYARRNHKLDEWHTYCEWVEGLPYFREICIEGMKK